ncbi:hypothetical protein [Mycobacterium sp. SMC-8]|uniref:hypothetical protein n=1 Tax=Mycobacterium sp. SMC-8 TaxID=2857060 RepID=UPI0021B48703|nr:hypothetical protein [Mycobacterium sp. SMC-8]
MGDVGGQAGEGAGVGLSGAAFVDDGAELAVAVEVVARLIWACSATAVKVMGRPARWRGWRRPVRRAAGRVCSCGCRCGDERAESGDELAVAVGFVDPSPCCCVYGQIVGVDALGGKESEGGGVGVKAGTGCEDVVIRAGTLRGCA